MRLNELEKLAKRRRLDAVLVCAEPNILALTGIRCDNAVLVGKVGRWESGKVGRWESGKVGKWEGGRVGKWEGGKVRRLEG